MPECSNCGGFVTPAYRRVNAVDGEVKACPNCEDRMPSSAHEEGWKEVRGTRHSGDPARYDPAYATDGGNG